MGSLSNLYQSTNQNRKMVLREKLRNTKMTKGEPVTSYLTRLSQVCDELAAVGEVVASTELIRIALNGFSKSWESYVRGIVARENMPSWERLWDDFVQEELRVDSTSSSTQHGGGDTDTVALAAKGKKKFSKKGPKAGDKKKSRGEQQRDMSKVKCFACHKFGHYAGQCPNKKKKQVAASADMEEFSSKFDREFSFVTCLATCSVSSSVWYIDNRASVHMFGVCEFFLSSMSEVFLWR